MKKLLPILFAALAATIGTISCERDIETRRDSDFIVPALTEDNTITLTVDAGVLPSVRLHLYGGKIAVDWGDGTPMTKDIHPEKHVNDVGYSWRMEFDHTYASNGEYTVRVWSEELTHFSMYNGPYGYPYENTGEISFGNCPVLEYASIEYFPGNKTLDLGGCPALKSLYVSYCPLLTSLQLDDCPLLATLSINNCVSLGSLAFDKCPLSGYVSIGNAPLLTKLDLSRHTNVTEVDCSGNGLTELKLHPGITWLNCSDNPLAGLDLGGYEYLESLMFRDCPQIASLNLDGCDKLRNIVFSGTKVSETFDFSAFPLLESIECRDSGLRSIDISGNPLLAFLDCSDNVLTELDVSGKDDFRYLLLQNNRLEAEALNAIFTALPISVATRMSVAPPPRHCMISFSGNPGAASCNTGLLTDKSWEIVKY